MSQISTKYSLPPPRLGNLDAEKRVDFVRAKNDNSEEIGAPRDPDDIPEASTSTSTTNFELRSVLEKSKKNLKAPKIEKIDEDDVIVIDDDVAKRKIKIEKNESENVNIRDLNGFLKAAKEGDLEEVRRFLEKKIPIDSADFFGWTATMCAAAEGNFEMCKFLLENGADPGSRDSRGHGILEIAKQKGHRLFAKKLIDFFCFPSQTPPTSAPEQMSFCESCNSFIPENSVSEHISSITHQLNDEKSAHGAAVQSGIQIGPSNIGYRLMCASGWTEDQGLGRYSDGHRFPIRTILKRNRTGLGLENPPKKITHFRAFDTASVSHKPAPKTGMSKKEIIRKKVKEDKIARRFRADFSDSDTVYDYFHGKLK